MNTVKLKVKRLAHCQAMPHYASDGAAGMDLCAAIDEPLTLPAGARTRIGTGIVIAVPAGYVGQVYPRSGLAAKAGISLTNCVGTIDSDYRGELQVLIINHAQEAYTFEPGERIAQLILMPVPRIEIEEVSEHDETERGSGGFGSTGRSGQVFAAG